MFYAVVSVWWYAYELSNRLAKLSPVALSYMANFNRNVGDRENCCRTYRGGLVTNSHTVSFFRTTRIGAVKRFLIMFLRTHCEAYGAFREGPSETRPQ